jgi:dTDP-glucose 4,6-dehydratase
MRGTRQTVLITGGLGTIGSVLTKELEARGHNVMVADLPHHHTQNYVRCDVSEASEVERVFRDMSYDYVYHAAAEFGRHNGEAYYARLWRTNVVGTKHILRMQEKYGFKLIFFSSSEVYGDYSGLMREDVMSTVPLRQMNDYAITKWVNEQQIMNSADQHDTQTVRVRLFNTYGVGEYYSPFRSAICQFIYKALHGQPFLVYKGHRRTSTYVTDTVRTLANIMSNFKAGEVYNIGGVDYHTMEHAAELVAQAVGGRVNIQLRDSEPFTTKDKQVDITKAVYDLDHKCEVDLATGIGLTVQWMREVYQK